MIDGYLRKSLDPNNFARPHKSLRNPYPRTPAIRLTAGTGRESTMMSYTPRLHTVLGRAAVEAKRAGIGAIGLEHVFLAILDEEDSIPSLVMRKLGVIDPVRSALEDLLASETYRTPGQPPSN
jgi:hypothetical protein